MMRGTERRLSVTTDSHPSVWVQKYVHDHSKHGPKTKEHHRPEQHWYMIDGDARWKIGFDVISIIFTMILCVIEPFIAAFVIRKPGIGRGPAERWWIVVIDLTQILWFTTDIALSFVTTYKGIHGSEIRDPQRICSHYFRGFFWWDLFSTFPWDRIISSLACSKRCGRKGAPIAILHMIPILRAMKLSKFARARELSFVFPDPSDLVGMGPVFDYVIIFVGTAFFVNHLFACIWYIIGDRARLKSLDTPCYTGDFDAIGRSARCTWLQLGGYTEGKYRRGYLYTTSLYWSVTTVTTVGYGDISANTTGEKIFAMFVEVVGVAFFASLITTFSAVLFAETDAEEERRRLKSQVKNFISKHRFPPDLALAVTSFLRRAFDVDQGLGGNYSDADKAVSALMKEHLNVPLKRAVALHIIQRDPVVGACRFLEAKPPVFVADCVLNMHASMAGPMEIVVPTGTRLDTVHLIVKGTVHVPRSSDESDESDESGGDSTPIPRTSEEEDDDDDVLCYESGDHFGDEGILLGATWTKTLVTTSWTEMSLISQESLEPLLEKFHDTHIQLRDECRALIAKYPTVFAIPVPIIEAQPVDEEKKFQADDDDDDDDLRRKLDALQRQMTLVLTALNVPAGTT